jgi:hypothetical protein
MSESNNVKFAEDNGKWLWKRYDASGSVIYRSPLFDTEREAREDYELNGEKNNGGPIPSDETPAGEVAPSTEAGQSQESAAEGTAESTAGTATGEENQQAENDNSAGSASL